MSDLDDPLFVQYMLSDDVAMAEASKIAYEHELNINANPETANDETQKLLNERFTEPHFLMPTYSNENVITIERPNKEYIMAVRGTRPTNINDLAADAQILFNAKNNIRFNSVKEVYKSFRAQEPTAKLTLTGHSLGADVAHNLANEYGEIYVGFNTPSSPLGLLNTEITNKHPQHKIYLTENIDVLSSLNKYTNFQDTIITIPQKKETTHLWTGSHDINNFTRSGLSNKKLKPKIIKTKRGRNTYYSTPNAEAVRRSATSDVYDNCIDNPSLEKCTKKINKAVGTPPHGGFGSTF